MTTEMTEATATNEIYHEDVEKLESSYVVLTAAIQERFNKLCNTNKSGNFDDEVIKNPVFVTDVTKEALKEAFLAGFSEGPVRQKNNCSCCLKFISKLGGLVYINEEGVLVSALWDEDTVHPYFKQSVALMRILVESAKITRVFYSSTLHYTPVYPGDFHHLELFIDAVPPLGFKSASSQSFESPGNVEMLLNVVKGQKADIQTQVQAYFKNDKDLINYPEMHRQLARLIDITTTFFGLKSHLRRNFLWKTSANPSNGGVVHLNGTVLGEFIDFVAEGGEWESAKRRFIKMIDPKFFRRPQGDASAGNIEHGEKIIATLGLATALERRYATLADVPTVWQPKPLDELESKGVFSSLRPRARPGNAVMKELPVIQGGLLTWERFVTNHLPTADQVHVSFPYRVKQNLGSLTTQVHDDAKPIMRWDKESKRNPIGSFAVIGGTLPTDVGLLFHQEIRMVAMTREPEYMGDNNTPMAPADIRILILEGGGWPVCKGVALFPDNLIHELRPVRATIEAYSNNGSLVGHEKSMVALILGGVGIPLDFDITVTTGSTRVKYSIDRSS